MLEGFFQVADLAPSKIRIPLVAQCSSCGLFRNCQSPKMLVDGSGTRKILIIGEGPAKNEDLQGRPFVGKAGQRIKSTLEKLSVDLRKNCWITNAIICRATKQSEKGNQVNRNPTDKEISFCRPNIIKTINRFQPNVILLLGASAVKSVIGWLWKEEPGPMERWRGWKIPCQKLNCFIVPTWHPSYIDRSQDKMGRDNPVMNLIWKNDLELAISVQSKPWKTVPDFRKQVKIIYDPREAASAVRKMYLDSDVPIAFDFETEGLKPDNPELGIFSCSLSNGKETISFPWHGDVITAVGEFLQSDVPKIGYHIKFEYRWVREKMKFRVKNFIWDGMIAAHILDNRSGVTGLKFQSFVTLGQESYDDEIKPYLKADNSNKSNRIREAPLDKLLLYGGMDSHLEWHVAQIQRKLLGFDYIKTEATRLYRRCENG